jgi:hypothetical protein
MLIELYAKEDVRFGVVV